MNPKGIFSSGRQEGKPIGVALSEPLTSFSFITYCWTLTGLEYQLLE